MNSYKIAFLNSKGGVGKSTLCILSALGLSQTRFDGKIKLIDTIGIDGDFIESKAFAYLAIRSYLKLPISFPDTTGVSKPCTGGVIIKHY